MRSLFILILLFTNLIYGQDKFYIPLNIKKAYEQGTRSYDGKPGTNYWQNSSNYKIKVKVEPSSKLVSGSEEIEYFNNSPDTLKELVIHLYQNIYKRGAERDFNIPSEGLTDGMVIKKFVYNNVEINMDTNKKVQIDATNLIYKLENPITPGSKSNIKLDWSFNLSTYQLRMGIYDSTSFFIAYWYPQISVYDDIDGWDKFVYSGAQEFYNDFSNYDVEITVPNTFAVWATGVLQNPEDVMNNKYLERYKKAHQSDKVVNIIAFEDLQKGGKFKDDNEFNSWKYKAENVTDFSFGMSDHYLWDAASVEVNKNSNERVYIAAVYKKESLNFYHVAEIGKRSIQYFSSVLPGVPYPYPSMTVFNGWGGMEFPMMINEGSFPTMAGTVGTTSHEIAHQYFPFYMGTNEKKYAWMDEGLAVMMPFDFQEQQVEANFPRERNAKQYKNLAGKELDMPSMIPSVLLKGTSYRMASYNKPGLGFDFLRDAIGKDLFDKAFREFINRWNGKHPTPFDFFFTFNEITGNDLNWFWLPWFFEKGYPDLAIKDVKMEDNKIRIVIEKVGNIPIPIKITLVHEDNSEVSIYKTAAVWENGEPASPLTSQGRKEIVIEQEINSKVKLVKLGAGNIPDAVEDNNEFVFGK